VTNHGRIVACFDTMQSNARQSGTALEVRKWSFS
jgi:hypothetical protein